MTQFTLQAAVKSEKGTGASRRLRKSGRVPAIIYGKDSQPLAITLEHDKLLHATEDKAFYQNNITLKIDDNSEKVVIKALQRHLFKPKILHADFTRV